MERQYVAIDLHLQRSLVVRENEAGEKVGTVRIDNEPMALAAALREAGEEPEVAIEATYGWYWAVDVLEELGAKVHLVNPSGLNWEDRRVKNDYRDCCDLLDRMRLGKLPEAWVAPPATRELRELVRYRAKVVCLRTGLKAQLKAVLAKHGLRPPVKDLWGLAGPAWLDHLQLPHGYIVRIESLRDLVEACDKEIDMLEREIHRFLRHDAGYAAIQAIPGVGRTIGAIFVAEIGDVSRFANPEALCSWAGLTPRHASPTPRSAEAASPRPGPSWCAGPPSRRSPTAGAAPSSRRTITASPPDDPRTWLGWRWLASCSSSSTTACATARSAASSRPVRRGEPDRAQPGRAFG